MKIEIYEPLPWPIWVAGFFWSAPISEAVALARRCYLIRWLAEPLQELGASI